jgi:restriction endonuclease S subunit
MKVAGVQDEQSGAIAGPNLIVVRPGRTLLPPLVLALLRSPSTVTKLASETAGTTVPSLNVSTVSRLRVSVPPQETQTELAELVRLGDEHYAAARRAAEVRRQIAQEVAVRALTK